MEIQNLEIEKIASLAKILREIKVGQDVTIPTSFKHPFEVRLELSRFKRLYGLEYTSTTIGVENGIKVTRIK